MSDNCYVTAKSYWDKVESTNNGMLGGFADLAEREEAQSLSFIKELAFTMNASACDIGAGIGRITESVLSKRFQNISLVEQNQSFLDQAGVNLTNNGLEITRFTMCCVPLQEWNGGDHCFDLIWAQWVLGYLNEGTFNTRR